MKRDDELLNAAFDAASVEDLARAKQGVAPRDAQAMDQARWIKEGLADLREIPEHQMSTDRLRDAILAQGLKPAPAAPRWGWLWMPATAALSAMALMVVLQNQRPNEPQLVIDGPAAFSQPFALDFKVTDEAISPPVTSPIVVEPTAPASTPRPTRRVASASRSEDTPSAPAAKAMATFSAAVSEGARAGMAALGSRSSSDRQSEPVATMMNASLPGAPDVSVDSGVVLIQAEKDIQTGAAIATEVNSTSNVLVGG